MIFKKYFFFIIFWNNLTHITDYYKITIPVVSDFTLNYVLYFFVNSILNFNTL